VLLPVRTVHPLGDDLRRQAITKSAGQLPCQNHEAAIFILRIGKYRRQLSDGCEDSRKIQRNQSNTGGIRIAVMRVKRQ
jgi:hypothetical protein